MEQRRCLRSARTAQSFFRRPALALKASFAASMATSWRQRSKSLRRRITWGEGSLLKCPSGYNLDIPTEIAPFPTSPLPDWENSSCISEQGPCSDVLGTCYPPLGISIAGAWNIKIDFLLKSNSLFLDQNAFVHSKVRFA